jgi:hypothetical protein
MGQAVASGVPAIPGTKIVKSNLLIYFKKLRFNQASWTIFGLHLFPIRFWHVLAIFWLQVCRQAQNLGVASIASDSAHSRNLAFLPQPPRGPRLIRHTLRIWPSALRPEPPPLRQTVSSTTILRVKSIPTFPHHLSSTLLLFSITPTMSCRVLWIRYSNLVRFDIITDKVGGLISNFKSAVYSSTLCLSGVSLHSVLSSSECA